MVYTDVLIGNLCLAKLGEESITSLDDDLKPAIWINKFFEFVVNEMLELYDWARATKRASLAQLADAPVSGYDYQYQLPNDCLYVLEATNTTAPYRIEGDKLLTNYTAIYIRYIYRGTDLNTAGPLFIDAVASRLASLIALPLTQSLKIKAMVDQEFAGLIQQAKWKDARERQEDDSSTDLWVDAQDNA